MKRKISAFFWLITFFAVCLCGCSTTKKLSGSGASEIVVLIIDEDNRPVKDFQLTVTQKNTDSSGFTNEQGMCYFHGIPDGQVLVTGCKKDYSQLHSFIQVQECGSVFCFKVSGAKKIFSRALELYKNKHYEQALTLVDNLYAQEETICSNAVHLFKAYGFLAKGRVDRAKEELNLTGKYSFLSAKGSETVIPYTITGELSFEYSQVYEVCGINGNFYNNSAQPVSSFTIVFYVFDSDGSSPVKGRNNIVIKIQEEVEAFSDYDFSLALDKYLAVSQEYEQDLDNPLYEIEYLYVSRIEYEDGSEWSDPFGLKYF